jgi:drug/metabolite transporter (DMT)-like permease
MASRRFGTLAFVFCTQACGLVLAGIWVAIGRQPVPGFAALVAAAGAGLSLAVCLAAFFQAMVVGTMSIVAPISALGVLVPIAAGIAEGERPGTLQIMGIIAAIAGIVLAARAPGDRSSVRVESGLGLALLSAVSGGLFFWLMAVASRHSVPWAVLVSRAIPVLALAAALRIRRASLRPALRSRNASPILTSALLGFAGIVLYAYATVHGALAIVSVLGSLYPAVTVLLAYHVLHERIHRTQQLGITIVLAGVLLLSTG